MSEALDRVENRGREKGLAEGKLKKAREIALNLQSMGMNMDFIAQAVNVSLAQVQQWLTSSNA